MPISGGSSYQVAGQFLMGGVSYPWYDFTVDINAYSMSSMIEAHLPLYPLNGLFNANAVTDFSQIQQANRTIPIEARLSYVQASSNTALPLAINFTPMETGLLDESTVDYAANEVTIKGRSLASLFQDDRAGGDVNVTKGLYGAALINYFYSQQSANLNSAYIAPQKTYAGKANLGLFASKSQRLSSKWDYMTEAAINDSYILYVHNGNLYYGPPAGNSAPTVNLAWGKDMLECSVNHASRRTHAIKVSMAYSHGFGKNHGVITYAGPAGGGGGGSVDAETFRFVADQTMDAVAARNKAVSIYNDLVKKEFIVNIKVVPDANLINVISQYGANFLVNIEGLIPSQSILYHVKSVRLTVMGGESPSVIVDMALENHPAIVGVSGYV